MMSFVISMLKMRFLRQKLLILFFIPAAVFELMILLNLLTGIFSILQR
jgi:hypothetical protein